MTEQQEKKNKNIALITSLAMHALLFLVFLFVVAWRAPNPPLPEYGIELNFGLDSQGSGEVQPVTPSGSETPANEEEQQVKNDKPDDGTKPVVEDKSQPEISKPVEQPVTTKQESPVTVKEEKKEQPKPVEKPVEKPKEKTETKPDVKPKDTESKSTTTADKTTAADKEGKPVSQGDKTDKTGDQGDPKGTPDANSLYANKGGGSFGLSLAGWDWAEKPKAPEPTDQDLFAGKVVFQIEIDEEGIVTKIVRLEGTLSAELERRCKEAIEKSSFYKTSPGKPFAKTVGTVTFTLRLK
jgi:outer membrane biosynthesis protein TonB